MKIVLQGFDGANPGIIPSRLADNIGVLSTNQKTGRGNLRPWKLPLTVTTIPASRNTIYRFGRDVISDTNYWFSWTGRVHAVKGYNTEDTTERTYYTGDGVPKWTDNTMAIASPPYPTTYRLLGVPAPIGAATLSQAGGVSTMNTTRYYCYTYVTNIGEESAPSPPAGPFICKTDANVTIASMSAAPGGYFIDRIRIYRTQSGVAGDTEFFFVKEISSALSSTTELAGTLLGGVIPSVGWLTPPADLTCLTAMWNGMMAGISKGNVRVCVAYKPYAWPIANEFMPPDAKAVALGRFGQNLVVLTTAKPMFVNGTSPDSSDQPPVEFGQACISEPSVVSFGDGVAWACPDGLAWLGAGGPRLLTTELFTRDDWQAMNPAGMTAGIYEGLYVCFYTQGGTRKGFMIDPHNPTGIYSLDVGYTALFFDEVQDALYVLSGTTIQKWDAAGAFMSATFKSRLWRSPAMQFPWGRVVADSYPITLKVTRTATKFDGTAVSATATLTVASDKPFKIPPGFKAVTWQMEVTTPGAGVTLAAIGETDEELLRV